MIETLWIHIGMGKTGTSAIQGYFDAVGDRIEQELGISYLQSGRINRAHQLLSPTYRAAKNTEWPQALENLRSELASSPYSTGLISSEFLCWDKEAFCKRLLVSTAGTKVKVVFFVREIGDLLYASFLQQVKNRPQSLANQGYRFSPFLKKVGMRFDFSQRLAPWIQVFGRESIHVVDYDRMPDRDSAAAMCDVLGIPYWKEMAVADTSNGSLNETELDLLRFMDQNCDLPADKRKLLIRFLASRSGRTRTTLPERFRPWIEKLYGASDEAFRREYSLSPREF